MFTLFFRTGTTVILALTSRNQELSWRFGSPYFRRLGLLHRAVDSGEELFRQTLDLKPQVVVINWELPDGDGFELCGRMRARTELQHVRLLMAVRREHLSANVRRKAERSGAHDVVAYPLSDEELFQHMAQVLGLPRRLGRRVHVDVKGSVEAAGRRYPGTVEDLGVHGARVRIEKIKPAELSALDRVNLHLKHTPGSLPVTLKGLVAWHERVAKGKGVTLGLEFQELDSTLRSAISEMSLWEVVPDSNPLLVVLQGDLTESADFGDLSGRLRGHVRFDLAGLRYINSTGVRSWTFFLESLTHLESYTFVRCSPVFLHQAAMIPPMLGRGKVASIYAPYLCDECDREDMRLLDIGPQTTAEDLQEAFQSCTDCNCRMILDDVAESLFGFLR